jgi:hypothetical protein
MGDTPERVRSPVWVMVRGPPFVVLIAPLNAMLVPINKIPALLFVSRDPKLLAPVEVVSRRNADLRELLAVTLALRTVTPPRRVVLPTAPPNKIEFPVPEFRERIDPPSRVLVKWIGAPKGEAPLFVESMSIWAVRIVAPVRVIGAPLVVILPPRLLVPV